MADVSLPVPKIGRRSSIGTPLLLDPATGKVLLVKGYNVDTAGNYGDIGVVGAGSNSGDTPPSLWQLRTLEVEVSGITTQTTAYAAVDAVGVGQSVDFGTPPNAAIVVYDIIISYDLLPTTAQNALLLTMFASAVGLQTDNGKLDITAAEQRLVAASFSPTNNDFGGLPTDTGGANAQVNTNVAGRPIPTAADGTVWMIGTAASAFTIAAAGKVYVKFVYRYANFVGVG